MVRILSVVAAVLVLIAGVLTIEQYKQNQKPASTPTPPDTSLFYSLDEVKKHNTLKDCWMVVESQVYDMTPFVSMHPGGPRIKEGCGTDATLLFNSIMEHNYPARETMKSFKIGRLSV